MIETPDAFDASHMAMGFPYCDTCKKAAVYSESFGMLHATSKRPFGVYPHEDKSGHEVTMKEWWNA